MSRPIVDNLENTIFTKKKSVDTHIKLEVFRLTVRTAEITWSGLDTSYFHSKDSVVYLEESDSPEGEFQVVTEIKLDTPPYFIDEHYMSTFYRTPVLYYRIRCPEDNVVSEVFATESRPNYYGAEISRRHAILLKEGHSGNLMYLFIRRRLGERCPNCWDTLRGVRVKTNCSTCLNTGYKIGYYNPIGLYVSLSQESVAVRQDVPGTEIQGNIQGWTSGFPRISMGDVLVDANTRAIWCVSQVGLTTHKRVPTKQELVMQHYDPDGSLLKLLERVPKTPGKKDVRHGEILF